MISYHPDSANYPVGKPWTDGFKAVEVDDPARIAKCISLYAWSPSRFVDGYREKTGFIDANWLALDFDSPEITLEEVVKSICDMVHVLGTTRNHGVEKMGITCDRFRVLLRAERVMTAPECLATLRHLADRWPIDPTCIDVARHFFACREIVSVGDGDGYLQEVVQPPKLSPRVATRQALHKTSRQLAFARNGSLPRWVRRFLEQGVLVRSKGRNNTIYAVSRELGRFGLSADAIYELIKQAPLNLEDIKDSSILATINSGLKRSSP